MLLNSRQKVSYIWSCHLESSEREHASSGNAWRTSSNSSHTRVHKDHIILLLYIQLKIQSEPLSTHEIILSRTSWQTKPLPIWGVYTPPQTADRTKWILHWLRMSWRYKSKVEIWQTLSYSDTIYLKEKQFNVLRIMHELGWMGTRLKLYLNILQEQRGKKIYKSTNLLSEPCSEPLC